MKEKGEALFIPAGDRTVRPAQRAQQNTGRGKTEGGSNGTPWRQAS